MEIQERKCIKCELIKSESDFYKTNCRGRVEFQSSCKECYKQYARDYRKALSIKLNKNTRLKTREQANKRINSQEKICCRCKILKSFNLFNIKSKSPDGKTSFCKSCSLKNGNINRRILRQKISNEINKFKETLGCLYCGEKESVCLDFHHINKDTKLKNLSRLVGVASIDRILIEIPKCLICCANCHRRLHKGINLIERTDIVDRNKSFEDLCIAFNQINVIDFLKCDRCCGKGTIYYFQYKNPIPCNLCDGTGKVIQSRKI